MLQKQIFSKLFYLILLLVASHANAVTYYSRVVTGNFADVGSRSTSPTGIPANATALAATDSVIIQNGHLITVAANQIIAGVTIGAGVLTFKDKSSLMQGTDVQNTGNNVYERNTAINPFYYSYYSSPTNGQTLIGIWQETLPDKFLSFNGANSARVYENTASTMTVGKGYAIRGPQSFHDTNRTAFLAKFAGIPNNGTINGENVIAGKSYIVGNPYPSAIKVSDFLSGSMRKADPGNNSVFFEPAREAANGEVKIWLNFSNPEGIFKQLLIGYVEGATNNYEDNFDGITSDANPYADFYSISDGKNLVIQGRAFPFDVSDVVVLGYRSAIDGNFSIAIDHTEGDANLNIYLEDKILNVRHDLKVSPYLFATLKGIFKERFALKYSSKSLGTGDFETNPSAVVVFLQDKIIKVASRSENIKTVYIYDISGRLLYEKNKIDNPSLSIERLQSANQILIVKVILNTNSETTKKIVF